MNFFCIFTSCDFKRNNIEEEEFRKHLNEHHADEILEISKKENISIKAVEMICSSEPNSQFIRTNARTMSSDVNSS